MLKKSILYLFAVLLSVTMSVAQTPTISNVTKLYVATFKRAPDVSGLDYWLNRSGLSLERIAQSFFEQPETKELYPDGYSNHDFIETVYQNLFDREPDTEGMEYWQSELDSNHILRPTFILAVINGAMDDDAVLLSNKEEVGEYFADADLNDKSEAYKVISMTDINPESVKRAKNYINSIATKNINMRNGWSREEINALHYLNQIRQSLGMKPFRADSYLHTAALNHSKYMVINNQSGHHEEEGRAGYTGEWPWDRTRAAGYPFNIVSENYAASDNYKSNIDSLFTAIYHRIGFLDFRRDEIGVGVYRSGDKNSYTYDMGNSKLRKFCKEGVSDFDGGAYYRPCVDPDIKLSVDKYREYNNINKNKNYVVYPFGKVKEGIFMKESPYPIPGYSFSGNPVSISFNPYNMDCSSVVMDSFILWDITDKRRVSSLTVMDKESDPNNYFSDCDFAFFPSEREEPGHLYKAIFKYEDSIGEHTVNWIFTISIPGNDISHLLKADKSISKFTIQRGEDYYIYIPPTQDSPSIGSYHYSYDRPEIELIDWYDSNTMHIRVSRKSQKGYIDMNINDKEVFLDVR